MQSYLAGNHNTFERSGKLAIHWQKNHSPLWKGKRRSRGSSVTSGDGRRKDHKSHHKQWIVATVIGDTVFGVDFTDPSPKGIVEGAFWEELKTGNMAVGLEAGWKMLSM